MTGDMVMFCYPTMWEELQYPEMGLVVAVKYANPIPDAALRGLEGRTWSYWVMLKAGKVYGPLSVDELRRV